jgi:hypothetical protein
MPRTKKKPGPAPRKRHVRVSLLKMSLGQVAQPYTERESGNMAAK